MVYIANEATFLLQGATTTTKRPRKPAMRGSSSEPDEQQIAADAPQHFSKIEIRGKHVIADNEILHELKGHRPYYSDESDGGHYAPTLV